jgi:RIO kinase 1
MDKYEAYERFEDFEEYAGVVGSAHRYAKERPRKKKPTPAAARAQLSDFDDSISAWVPSYAAALDPRHHERQWLIDSIGPFYRDNVISDVTHRVKGGKEANVYRCTAHPAAGVPFIAAKLYRPRELRTLKNDAVYKAGRQLRGEDGKLMKGRREKLALAQKSTFGKQLDMTWWIGNEFSTQQALFEAGAAVPRPIAHQGNAILMDYVGDERMAAPTLIDSAPDRDEAAELFDLIMDNVALMLQLHRVHGDLSPYNILHWDGRIVIIDFPQMVDARTNPHAYELLRRDVARVCAYFARFGVRADAERLARDLWLPYMGSLP